MISEASVRQLTTFVAVVELGTFGAAAQQLGFSQSAVSQQIASLERLVGQPLFDRLPGPRRPALTAAGELLLEGLEGVLESLAKVEVDLERLRRGEAGSLAIGTFQSVSTRVLPTAIGRLRAEVDPLDISLVEDANLTVLLAKLTGGEIDLCFIVGDVGEDFESEHLVDDPLVAVVQPSRLDCESEIHPDWLKGRALVGLAGDDACQLSISSSLAAAGISPEYVFRSVDNGAVQAMVGAGVGVAVMPVLTVDPDSPDTRLLVVRPALEPRRIGIAWRRGQSHSPVARRFIEIVREVCAERVAAVPH